MRTQNRDLIRLGAKMDKLAEQMREIYHACRRSDNPNARALAHAWNGNSFDLWCWFESMAVDAIEGEYPDPGLPEDENEDELIEELE